MPPHEPLLPYSNASFCKQKTTIYLYAILSLMGPPKPDELRGSARPYDGNTSHAKTYVDACK